MDKTNFFSAADAAKLLAEKTIFLIGGGVHMDGKDGTFGRALEVCKKSRARTCLLYNSAGCKLVSVAEMEKLKRPWPCGTNPLPAIHALQELLQGAGDKRHLVFITDNDFAGNKDAEVRSALKDLKALCPDLRLNVFVLADTSPYNRSLTRSFGPMPGFQGQVNYQYVLGESSDALAQRIVATQTALAQQRWPHLHPRPQPRALTLNKGDFHRTGPANGRGGRSRY